MNVNRLWKQRIERDLSTQIIDEDFDKLLKEYERSSKITRKRAREISRKLIGVYPDQVISWFNYKTWLSMKYLPNSSTVKDSYKISRHNEYATSIESTNSSLVYFYKVIFQNFLTQSLKLDSNNKSPIQSADSLLSQFNGTTYQNLLMLAEVADTIEGTK